MLVAVLVLLAHYGYKLPSLYGDPDVSYITLMSGQVVKERSWLYYIFNAVLVAALLWWMLPTFNGKKFTVWAIGTCACTVGIFESLESVICATASIGHNFMVPFGDRLCTARFGPWFGPELAVLTVLVMLKMRKP